jgi:alpha/beta hydrolase fold
MHMPTVDIDGIVTHYQISGSGPPILMMAPGGFDSAIEKWSTTWPWQHFLPLQTFAREYTCIAYDCREAGQSGGRVEKLTWAAYADQAKGLLDHLGVASAFIMGSCLGCSPVIAFAARYPEACRGLVIAQPSGGVKRRLTAHRHFNLHQQYVQDSGLEAVVERDTIPGAEPEELMALKLPTLILPGHTDFHATSCARYLEECIPGAEYWDVHLESQSPDHIRDRILGFLATHAGAGVHA